MSRKYHNFKIVYGFKSQDVDEDTVILSALDKNTKYSGLTVAFLECSKGFAFSPWYGFECSYCPSRGVILLDDQQKHKIEEIAQEYWDYYDTDAEQRKLEFAIGLGSSDFDFINLVTNIPIWERGDPSYSVTHTKKSSG